MENVITSSKKRKFQPILDISSTLADGEYFPLKYDKTCRSMFILKRDIVLVNLKEKKRLAETNPRSSDRLINQAEGYERKECDELLPNCIFCNKDKYVRKTNIKKNYFREPNYKLMIQSEKRFYSEATKKLLRLRQTT